METSQRDRSLSESAGARWAGPAAALLVFTLATVAVYGELWERGIDRVVPTSSRGAPYGARMKAVGIADVTYETWLVARNAQTLATQPWRLFDTPHCAPTEKSLTLGIPMITLGALAIPPWLATREALPTYDWALVILTFVGAWAAYALFTAWTGLPAAGIAAGLLYAFHPIRLQDIGHPSVWDVSWCLLGLLFAERWLARGRWRDALALAAAIVLQVGASFYSLLAAALLATPFAVWTARRHGLRRISAAQGAAVAAIVVLGVALLLGPYLDAPRADEVHGLRFARPASYLPGSHNFPGWSLLALAIFALAAPRSWAERRDGSDPRWVLIASALGVAVVAAGPLYRLLATVVPGLDVIRMAGRLVQGAQLGLVLLAGLGVAALVRRSGRHGTAVGALLVALVAFDLLRVPAWGLERRYRWGYAEIAPAEQDVTFFAELERRGNTGPLLEVPVDGGWSLVEGPARILLSLHHGRRTSACFGSYPPKGRPLLAALAKRLPEADAIAALRSQGFTTVILHLPEEATLKPRQLALLQRFERASRERKDFERIHGSARKVAFVLGPARSRGP